ncbi:uncharacterized protein CLUP02_07988 [Colletotrichum lupini]|uniref:DNA-directed RNA polymerase RBP11-like dimerisation domain-containing protein n=1 Tax=Colletotrichum lupini TaxID=145971 RepID=A0A9Q8SS96_9PEZI|nr:uncharacterized protein CLUP02_07988 [Colletotrichum lupini]UQC82500.1 hypothetical protein CLUP02_07988 [Colletotrichum lupini]
MKVKEDDSSPSLLRRSLSFTTSNSLTSISHTPAELSNSITLPTKRVSLRYSAFSYLQLRIVFSFVLKVSLQPTPPSPLLSRITKMNAPDRESMSAWSEDGLETASPCYDSLQASLHVTLPVTLEEVAMVFSWLPCRALPEAPSQGTELRISKTPRLQNHPLSTHLSHIIFELFLLGEGEKKIEENVFSGMSNTSDFVIKKEDHTLGNLLSEHLKMHKNVLMAGYKIAHPNVPEMFIRVQTDGTITAKEALVQVIKKLMQDLSHLSREFTREFELRRMVEAGRSNQQGQ